MSAFRDRFKADSPQQELNFQQLDFLLDIAPAVRDVLVGVQDDEGKEVVKGSSITIWMDGSRLKFVINLTSTKEKGWGIISEPRRLWESLELAMVKGEVDWKAAKSPESELTY